MEQFDILQTLGKGSFGVVRKVRRRCDAKTLVVKEMDYGRADERQKQQIVAEVNILRELRHPFIVRYYDRIVDRRRTRLHIVMEYCATDLARVIKAKRLRGEYLDENFLWNLMSQVVMALEFCHYRVDKRGAKKPIIHRDLKPENVFLTDDDTVKLGDFGLAKELNGAQLAETSVGTPYYMSPELINEQRYDERTDVWSMGCLMYEAAALTRPFNANNQLALALKINSGKVAPIPSRYSSGLFAAIEWMLNKARHKRPRMEDLRKLPGLRMPLLENNLVVREFQLQQSYIRRLREVKTREAEVTRRETELTESEAALRLRAKTLIINPPPQHQPEALDSKTSPTRTVGIDNISANAAYASSCYLDGSSAGDGGGISRGDDDGLSRRGGARQYRRRAGPRELMMPSDERGFRLSLEAEGLGVIGSARRAKPRQFVEETDAEEDSKHARRVARELLQDRVSRERRKSSVGGGGGDVAAGLGDDACAARRKKQGSSDDKTDGYNRYRYTDKHASEPTGGAHHHTYHHEQESHNVAEATTAVLGYASHVLYNSPHDNDTINSVEKRSSRGQPCSGDERVHDRINPDSLLDITAPLDGQAAAPESMPKSKSKHPVDFVHDSGGPRNRRSKGGAVQVEVTVERGGGGHAIEGRGGVERARSGVGRDGAVRRCGSGEQTDRELYERRRREAVADAGRRVKDAFAGCVEDNVHGAGVCPSRRRYRSLTENINVSNTDVENCDRGKHAVRESRAAALAGAATAVRSSVEIPVSAVGDMLQRRRFASAARTAAHGSSSKLADVGRWEANEPRSVSRRAYQRSSSDMPPASLVGRYPHRTGGGVVQDPRRGIEESATSVVGAQARRGRLSRY